MRDPGNTVPVWGICSASTWGESSSEDWINLVMVSEIHLSPNRRGSMCLKEDSSEEDLADSLYSEIDYII